MQSRPAPRPGWRLTSYAYLLLKPRGPEVDRIAPLKLDLDFLDTSGYVVIPIESPVVVIDALNENGSSRPVTDLEITQTLDERQAEDGKLIVEISATARGLVPPLDQILDTARDQFEIVSIDDQGVLPTRFDKEADQIQIVSDRSWTVEYQAVENQPRQFSFADPVGDVAAVKFQRYEGADLVASEPKVALEKSYGVASWNFLYWLIPLVVLGLLAVVAVIQLNNRPMERPAERFQLPDEVNPFTVLTLLKDIQQRNGITPAQSSELQQSIDRIEQTYFGHSESTDAGNELEQVARTWVNRAR
jgi:hypothetical protein